MECSAETFAYYTCLIVVFVDLMGQHFTLAVNVPYSMDVGASIKEVSYIMTANMGCRLLGNLIMPKFADSTSRKLAMQISTLGSGIAYFVSGAAQWANGRDGFWVLMAGRVLGGLFGGSLSLAIAYITELTMPDSNDPNDIRKERMATLKQRINMVMSVFNVAPICLAPIGGAVGTLGLNIPFLVAAAVAMVGLFVTLKFMKDVEEVKALSIAEYEERYAKDTLPASPDIASPEPLVGVKVELDETRSNVSLGEAEESEVAAAPENAAALEASVMVPRGRPRLSAGDTMKDRDQTLSHDDPEVVRKSEPKTELQSPWGDKIVWFQGLGYFCLGSNMVMGMMILPLMLNEDKFGLQGTKDSLERGEDVAKLVGLISIPQGAFGFLFQSFMYMWMSKNGLSDRLCMALAAIAMAAGNVGMAFTDQLYQCFIASAVMGGGQGLLFGAFVSLPTAYIATHYPHAVAEARSIPMNFLYLGLTLGPIVSGEVYVSEGQKVSWYVVAATICVGGVLLGVTATMIQSVMKDPLLEKMELLQVKTMLKTNAMPKEKFIQSLHSDVDRLLRERNYYVWNGRLQIIIKRLIEKALPPLRPFTAKDHGAQHMDDIATLLLHNLGDYEAFRALEIRTGRTFAHLESDTNHSIGHNPVSAYSGLDGVCIDQALSTYEERASRLRHRRDAPLMSPRSPTLERADSGLYDTEPYTKASSLAERLAAAGLTEEELELAINADNGTKQV